MHLNADRAQKLSIEELVPVSRLSVTQFGVQNFRQLFSDSLVFGIYELGHQNPGKIARKAIELDGEFFQLCIRQISRLKTIEIGIIDGPMSEDKTSHSLIKRHRSPPHHNDIT